MSNFLTRSSVFKEMASEATSKGKISTFYKVKRKLDVVNSDKYKVSKREKSHSFL